jgi:WD40 repeat protein
MKTSITKRIEQASVFPILLTFLFCLPALAAAQSVTLPERDTTERQTIRKMPREIGNVRFFDDSTILYVSGNDLYLSPLCDDGSELVFRGHSGSIHDSKAMPDGRRIVTASADGTLRLWDSRTGGCLAVSERLDTISQPFWTMLNEIVLEPDGRRLMTSDMDGLKVWSSDDLRFLSKEDTDYFYMTTGLISPNWKTVGAPVPESYDDCAVFDLSSGDVLLYLDSRYPLCYSPDGGRILVADMETGAMEIYDIDPNAPRGRFSGVWVSSSRIPLTAAAFSPDGGALASAQEGGYVCLWDTRDGTARSEFQWEGHGIDGVCFDPKGRRLLAFDSEDGALCIWDL